MNFICNARNVAFNFLSLLLFSYCLLQIIHYEKIIYHEMHEFRLSYASWTNCLMNPEIVERISCCWNVKYVDLLIETCCVYTQHIHTCSFVRHATLAFQIQFSTSILVNMFEMWTSFALCVFFSQNTIF
jgi:hypothetical protein